MKKLVLHHYKPVGVLALLMAFVTSPTVFAQDWGLESLAHQFAGLTESRSAFVERKSSSVLDETLESRGTLYYQAPDKLTKAVTQPEKATWFIYGDEVILEQPGEAQKRFPIDAHPALRPLATSIRSLLAGRIKEIERYYSTRLDGDISHWELVLTPNSDIVRPYIRSITISGELSHIKQVLTISTNGDTSDMRLIN